VEKAEEKSGQIERATLLRGYFSCIAFMAQMALVKAIYSGFDRVSSQVNSLQVKNAQNPKRKKAPSFLTRLSYSGR